MLWVVLEFARGSMIGEPDLFHRVVGVYETESDAQGAKLLVSGEYMEREIHPALLYEARA